MDIIYGTPERAHEFARALQEHFTEKALSRIRSTDSCILIASADGEDIGFVIYRIDDEGAEIEWIGVRWDRWRQGVGTSLLNEVEAILSKNHVRSIKVRTLDDSVGYAPYFGTKAFYRARGFVKTGTEEVPG